MLVTTEIYWIHFLILSGIRMFQRHVFKSWCVSVWREPFTNLHTRKHGPLGNGDLIWPSLVPQGALDTTDSRNSMVVVLFMWLNRVIQQIVNLNKWFKDLGVCQCHGFVNLPQGVENGHSRRQSSRFASFFRVKVSLFKCALWTRGVKQFCDSKQLLLKYVRHFASVAISVCMGGGWGLCC